jgi:hypothetical protein
MSSEAIGCGNCINWGAAGRSFIGLTAAAAFAIGLLSLFHPQTSFDLLGKNIYAWGATGIGGLGLVGLFIYYIYKSDCWSSKQKDAPIPPPQKIETPRTQPATPPPLPPPTATTTAQTSVTPDSNSSGGSAPAPTNAGIGGGRGISTNTRTGAIDPTAQAEADAFDD